MHYSEITGFRPWQPSTWPTANDEGINFFECIERILNETILGEIGNVISDSNAQNGSLGGRGHVVALSLFCAIDTISSYAFENTISEQCPTCLRGDRVGPRYIKYISEFFPDDYKTHAEVLYGSYRNSLVHSWNLFKVAIWPKNEPIRIDNGILNLGLISFYEALNYSIENFLIRLKSDPEIYHAAMRRYETLRQTAK